MHGVKPSTTCSLSSRSNSQPPMKRYKHVSHPVLRSPAWANILTLPPGDEQISPEVKVQIYTPPGADANKLPLIVYLHGGGWLSGNLNTEDYECRNICAKVHALVVSVEYRVFPFVKFPVPIDDCYLAYQWVSLSRFVDDMYYRTETNGLRHMITPKN